MRPLELCLLPQGLEDLHGTTLDGQRFCEQALKEMWKTGCQAFCTWPSTKIILFLQWDSHAYSQGLAHFFVRNYDGSICAQLDKSSNISFPLGHFFIAHVSKVCGSPKFFFQLRLHAATGM